MSGCSSCSRKRDCGPRKQRQAEGLAAVLERLYPTRRWGEPDDEARFGAGVGEDEARRLADRMAAKLGASALFCPGTPEESCDYIYVMCVGREPSLLRARERTGELADEAGMASGSREVHLRVMTSSMARVAAIQEVVLEARRELDGWSLVERPRPGVYDPALLGRMRQVVAALGAAGIEHFDFGCLVEAPIGFDSGSYSSLYRCEPAVVNYLFYPQPATTVVTSLLAVGRGQA